MDKTIINLPFELIEDKGFSSVWRNELNTELNKIGLRSGVDLNLLSYYITNIPEAVIDIGSK